MARAIASLGVDRGIVAFQRHVFAERLGQSPLAVSADRIVLSERGGVRLLSGLDPWLDQLRWVDTGGIEVRRRAVEQAVYTHACRGTAADLVEVFVQVGRCHEAVARSGSARAQVQPLVLTSGQRLLTELFTAVREDLELRVAVAFATSHVPGAAPMLGGLRSLLSPVAVNGRRVVWTERTVPVSLAMGWYAALCEAARRRGFPDTADVGDDLAAVAGVGLGFTRGPALPTADLWELVAATLDLRRCADLLGGLLTVDWSGVPLPRLPAGPASVVADPVVDLLVPFTGDGLVEIAGLDGALGMRLLPDRAWPALLRARAHRPGPRRHGPPVAHQRAPPRHRPSRYRHSESATPHRRDAGSRACRPSRNAARALRSSAWRCRRFSHAAM
jgi:CRISPR-associated protein Csx17